MPPVPAVRATPVRGSIYGSGPYGKGLYSQLAYKSAGVFIGATSSISVGAHVMWTPIPVADCEPWTLIARCQCPSNIVWPA